MELQSYVTQTILQVLKGVAGAQDENGDNASYIAPNRGGDSTVERIDFDVEVKTVEGSGSKGGLGVFVGAVSAGTSGQSQSESTTAGRIKFGITVVFRADPKWK